MKTTELKKIIEETLQNEVKKAIMEQVSEEVYIIKNKDGEPIEQCETEEEAQKAMDEYKKNHPDQELIIEKGKKLSFEDLDDMSEKLESMENINETQHKGHFTIDQVIKLAKKAGEVVPDAEDDLMELGEMYGDKIPASRVFEILDDYDMPELKSKIKVKKTEPKEGNAFTGALAKAKEEGDDEFTVDGKKFDVEEEKEECTECGGGYPMEEENEDPQFGDIDKLLDAGAEEEVSEEAHVCEKCGKEVCECGDMYESKKSIQISESELVKIIRKMVAESVPGLSTFEKAHKESGSQNKEALSDIEKKIKEYLNFDGNDNPEFPNQIGGEVKARRADEKEAEEVADHRGGGLEDLIYDIDPSEEAQERHKKALTGDSTMGNSQDAANVVPSKLGEKIIKKVKRKDKEEAAAPMYNKDVQPVKVVKESEDASTNVISEEIKRMKEMVSYNQKTQ